MYIRLSAFILANDRWLRADDLIGEVAEWSIALDLKSSGSERNPGVRISPSPFNG